MAESMIAATLRELGVEMTATERPGDVDGWQRGSVHWHVTFRRGNEKLETSYSVGPGAAYPGSKQAQYKTWASAPSRFRRPDPEKPAADSVMDCILSDTDSVEQTFTDWCATFGENEDSRAALATYLACQASLVGLRRLLGSDGLARLRACERL